MPSSLAFLIAGRIASESMARMIRTFAPLRDQALDVGELLGRRALRVGGNVFGALRGERAP